MRAPIPEGLFTPDWYVRSQYNGWKAISANLTGNYLMGGWTMH